MVPISYERIDRERANDLYGPRRTPHHSTLFGQDPELHNSLPWNPQLGELVLRPDLKMLPFLHGLGRVEP